MGWLWIFIAGKLAWAVFKYGAFKAWWVKMRWVSLECFF